MDKERGQISYGAILLVALIGVIIGYAMSPKLYMGGIVHNVQETFDEGIAVDGTERISGTGGASFTTGAFSGAITGASTLTMTGETNLVNLVYGGSTTTLATTSQAHIQLTAAQFCDYSVMTFDPSTCPSSPSSTVLYLPTGAQLIADCIPTAGDRKMTTLYNTAAGTSAITVTASTSIVLLEPSGGDVVIANNAAGTKEWANIECINYNGVGTVACIVISIQDAD